MASASAPLPRRAAEGSGVVVRRQPWFRWDGAGMGVLVPEAVCGLSVREVVAVASADQFDAPNQRELTAFLRQAASGVLAGAVGWSAGAGLELRYVAEPQVGGLAQVRLFVTGKAMGHTEEAAAGAADAIAERACAALPRGFAWQPVDAAERAPRLPVDSVLVDVRKQEEALQPQSPNADATFYYVAHPLAGDGSGWPAFGLLLSRVSRPVVVSLLFVPTALDAAEHSGIQRIVTGLAWYGNPRQETDGYDGSPFPVPADGSAAAALPVWQGYQTSLHHCVLARATVAGDEEVARSVATALANAVSVNPEMAGAHAFVQRPRPAELDRAAHSFERLDVVPWGGHSLWEFTGAPTMLRRLPYLFSMAEAATLAVLPVPDEQGAPGFALRRAGHKMRPRARTAADGLAVKLGAFQHEGAAVGDAELPLRAVNQHVLVVGSPGSGKTTTVLSLLVQLWREHRVPFLVIEPTKTEYRSLLDVPGLDALRVVTLGREDIAPIRLNPLEPPPGRMRETHVNNVMAAFRAATNLFPPLPQLLEDALERSYELAGWDHDTTLEDGRTPPTLRDVVATFAAGFDEHGYSGQVRDNLLAALRLRLRSLTRGTRGMLLDTVESVDFAELIERPVVMELDEIADAEDKAVLAAFILDRIRSAARHRGSSGGRLEHVTVLEEAHRVLSRDTGGDVDSARKAAVDSFCEAIAVLRAYGEGFIISSQSPSGLAENAVTNTGTKVLHRLESAADREVVLSALDASPDERKAAARLERGEAVARWPDMDEPVIVRVEAPQAVDSGHRVGDPEVRERMRVETDRVRRLLPYRLCTRDVCSGGCDAAVRVGGRALARDVKDDARVAWQRHAGRITALAPIAARIAREGADSQVGYCCAAHLASEGDAFAVPGKDIRRTLAKAIRTATDERTS